MTLIDIEQETTFTYFDDDTKTWKHKTGTVKELLEIYTAYEWLNVIDLNKIRWGTLKEYGRKQKLF